MDPKDVSDENMNYLVKAFGLHRDAGWLFREAIHVFFHDETVHVPDDIWKKLPTGVTVEAIIDTGVLFLLTMLAPIHADSEAWEAAWENSKAKMPLSVEFGLISPDDPQVADHQHRMELVELAVPSIVNEENLIVAGKVARITVDAMMQTLSHPNRIRRAWKTVVACHLMVRDVTADLDL